ncbi:MAG: hypothetical protein JRH10_14815 [Deltaproteobacteria bacterium]|nr:hypothetical protein [Deltaproteobacteria bacterium]MBW2446648.1 hypothetical protein [Deltaproteobacteria bacterium]
MTRASAIYRNPYLYQALMRALYGPYYEARYRAVAVEIPEETEVVELCAGDCRLYLKHLRSKRVRYVALDNARPLVDWARRHGVDAREFDVARDPIPQADVVLMQASLYQFLPDVEPVIERMLDAARQRVVIAEPVRNLTQTLPAGIVRWARKLTQPAGDSRYRGERFDAETLQSLFERFDCKRSFAIPGGRERVGVFEGRA